MRRDGIELALDIAFQVSPDHPMVLGHPEWFRRRPDGSVQYAENPGYTTGLFTTTTTNTSYVPTRVLKEGTLHWRVQAIDGTSRQLREALRTVSWS